MMPDHSAFAGHFPGNPVVPGVILLQRVLGLLLTHIQTDVPLTIADAKFVRPLRPGETCTIAIRRQQARRLAFECRTQDELLARGSLLLGPDT